MTTIALFAPVFDPIGYVLLRHAVIPDLIDVHKRVSRTSTLDTGAHVIDNGAHHGDRTFTVSIPRCDPDQRMRLRHLVDVHADLLFSSGDGLYRGHVESLIFHHHAQLRFLVLEKLG